MPPSVPERLRHCGRAGRPPGLLAIIGAAVLRPRPAEIVEIDAPIVWAAVEENRTCADRTTRIGVDVARDRTVAVARPTERGWGVVQGEIRNASPSAAATAARVSTEPAVAVVGMIGGIAHVVKPGWRGGNYLPPGRWQSRGRGAMSVRELIHPPGRAHLISLTSPRDPTSAISIPASTARNAHDTDPVPSSAIPPDHESRMVLHPTAPGKRYTRTVDVAAVRDLYRTVMNEGANRGILVTTSSFGPASHEIRQGQADLIR
jgi:hypothetical protein